MVHKNVMLVHAEFLKYCKYEAVLIEYLPLAAASLSLHFLNTFPGA